MRIVSKKRSIKITDLDLFYSGGLKPVKKIYEKTARIWVIMHNDVLRMSVGSSLRSLGFTEISSMKNVKSAYGREDAPDWILSSIKESDDVSGFGLLKATATDPFFQNTVFTVLKTSTIDDIDKLVPHAFSFGALSAVDCTDFTKQKFEDQISKLFSIVDSRGLDDKRIAMSYFIDFAANSKLSIDKTVDVTLRLEDIMGDGLFVVMELANAYRKAGRDVDAEYILSPDGRLFKTINNIAAAMAQNGMADKAIEKYTKIVSNVTIENPRLFATVRYNLAIALLRAEKTMDEVEAWLKPVVDLIQQEGTALTQLDTYGILNKTRELHEKIVNAIRLKRRLKPAAGKLVNEEFLSDDTYAVKRSDYFNKCLVNVLHGVEFPKDKLTQTALSSIPYVHKEVHYEED